jgi:hypothetical protein
LQDFLDERKCDKIDSGTLVALLTKIRQLELDNEYQADGDEYLDAFVALGGSPTKEDFVLKSTLIEIIKMEFELTIDMEVSFTVLHTTRNAYGHAIVGLLAQDWRRQ